MGWCQASVTVLKKLSNDWPFSCKRAPSTLESFCSVESVVNLGAQLQPPFVSCIGGLRI
jgi:hypothetical protein